MSTLSILHRDIKLTNIFIGKKIILPSALKELIPFFSIDAKGDCKGLSVTRKTGEIFIPVLVGDFGLATSSLAAVDPSDVSKAMATEDMTYGTNIDIFTVVHHQ